MFQRKNITSLRSSAWTPAILSAAAWGVLPVLTRLAWKEKSAASSAQVIFLFLFIRFAFSSVLMRLLLRVFQPHLSAGPRIVNGLRTGSIPRKLLGIWVGISLLNFFIITLALSEIPAGTYTLVFSIHPILGVLFASPSKAGAYVRKHWAGLFLTLIGTLTFCATEDFSGEAPSWLGWLSLVAGMLTWLSCSLVGERLITKDVSPHEVTEATQWIGVLGASAVLFQGSDMRALVQSEPKILICALITGVLGIIAFGSFQVALSKSTRIAFLAQYFEPIAAFVTSGILLGERVSSVQWIAATFTLYGLYRLMEPSDVTSENRAEEQAPKNPLEIQAFSAESLPS